MDLREESLAGENQVKDVTLSEETAVNAAESVKETETISEVETLVGEVTDKKFSLMTKEELVKAMEALLNEPIDSVREMAAHIKLAFMNLRKAEVDAEKAEFIANGNEESAFVASDDANENKLKDILNQLKEKRAEYNNAQEALKQQNLERKQAIITEIKAIAVDPDSVNKQYTKVQQLQQ